MKWPHISAARVIVESSLSNYRIDPSQGTHFFQNLTSMGVAYFTINPSIGDGVFDLDYLNSLPAQYESERVRIIRFAAPPAHSRQRQKRRGRGAKTPRK